MTFHYYWKWTFVLQVPFGINFLGYKERGGALNAEEWHFKGETNLRGRDRAGGGAGTPLVGSRLRVCISSPTWKSTPRALRGGFTEVYGVYY